MISKERKILLLVEGKSTEVNLFSRIIDCFPEIDIKKDNIIVYNTNLFALNQSLIKEFGNEWNEEEIDFLSFLKSSPNTKGQITNLKNYTSGVDISDFKFTDIFLIFDYERQDPLFDTNRIKKMLSFWNESTENGLLYINYPMIEAYKHLKAPLPDIGYLSKKCTCPMLFSKENKKNKYKQVVGNESSFTDLNNYTRELFRNFVIHNLCKASTITKGTTDISDSIAKQYWENIDYNEILDVENFYSNSKEYGFVYVLATCLFFIPEYNSKLIFEN
ncbi:MAG: hypothetical protein IKS13_10830 [Ruminococcus sp.]|nr:hypothetical protein [Ruminococcus sp.]